MKLYVRDEQNKIIGFKEILEENEKENKIIKLEKKLKECKFKQVLSLNEKDKEIRKMLYTFYQEEQQKIKSEINRIYGLPTYKYEEMFNFNVQPDKLEYISYIPEHKKEKIKSMNNTLRIKREGQKRKDTKIITLDPEYYK